MRVSHLPEPSTQPGLLNDGEIRAPKECNAHREEVHVEDGRGEADVRPHAGAGVAGAEAGEEKANI